MFIHISEFIEEIMKNVEEGGTLREEDNSNVVYVDFS